MKNYIFLIYIVTNNYWREEFILSQQWTFNPESKKKTYFSIANGIFSNTNNTAHFRCNTQIFEKSLQ